MTVDALLNLLDSVNFANPKTNVTNYGNYRNALVQCLLLAFHVVCTVASVHEIYVLLYHVVELCLHLVDSPVSLNSLVVVFLLSYHLTLCRHTYTPRTTLLFVLLSQLQILSYISSHLISMSEWINRWINQSIDLFIWFKIFIAQIQQSRGEQDGKAQTDTNSCHKQAVGGRPPRYAPPLLPVDAETPRAAELTAT